MRFLLSKLQFIVGISFLVIHYECVNSRELITNGPVVINSVFNQPQQQHEEQKQLQIDQLNDTPIIGVLSQEISYHLNGKWPGVFKSYIAASYVKFIEGGGGRVVPIWIGQPKEYYEDIMTKINGVLWPGGATWFNQSDGYADAGRHIYNIAMDLNEKGIYMPIWGTCLGYELMAYITSEHGEIRSDCSSDRQSLHLEFEPDFRNSKLFGKAPEEIINILSTEQVTPNFHHYCVTKKNLTDFGLDDTWKVLSVNDDVNGLEFISTMEHRKYPFFGVQFHPEKNIYEWVINRNISHTKNAIKTAQYFANFFVDQSRMNLQHFKGGVDEENSVLIYNYPTNFTALVKSAYEECYLFDENVGYRTFVGVDDNIIGDNDDDDDDGNDVENVIIVGGGDGGSHMIKSMSDLIIALIISTSLFYVC